MEYESTLLYLPFDVDTLLLMCMKRRPQVYQVFITQIPKIYTDLSGKPLTNEHT